MPWQQEVRRRVTCFEQVLQEQCAEIFPDRKVFDVPRVEYSRFHALQHLVDFHSERNLIVSAIDD